jgi:hypothetical protein
MHPLLPTRLLIGSDSQQPTRLDAMYGAALTSPTNHSFLLWSGLVSAVEMPNSSGKERSGRESSEARRVNKLSEHGVV